MPEKRYGSCRSYYRRFAEKIWDEGRHWALGKAGLAIVLLVIATFVAFKSGYIQRAEGKQRVVPTIIAWGIVGLAYFLYLAIRAPWLMDEDKQEELVRIESKLETSENELERLSALSDDDPWVVVRFESEPLEYPARHRLVPQRPLYIANIGKRRALNVRIDHVVFPKAECRAIFDGNIPILEPEADADPVAVFVPIEDTSGVTPKVTQFEVALQVEWSCYSLAERQNMRIPLVIHYKDSIGNQYTMNLEIQWMEEQIAEAGNYRPIKQRSASQSA